MVISRNALRVNKPFCDCDRFGRTWKPALTAAFVVARGRVLGYSTPCDRSSLTSIRSRTGASGRSSLQKLQGNRLRPSLTGVRTGCDLLCLRPLHPGFKILLAIRFHVIGHLQRRSKCCEALPKLHFAGFTLKPRKRGRTAAGNDHLFRDQGLLHLRGKSRHPSLRSIGRRVLNPLRGRAGHQGHRPFVLAPQNSIYPVTHFDEHGTWVLVREAYRRAKRTSRHLRQADPYSLADETWRDPPRRSSTSSRSRSPDRRPGPAEHYRLDADSSDKEPPQDAESLRTGRSAYCITCLGAYTTPTHAEPIALRSRRIGTTEQPPPKAAPKIIFGSKPPLPKELPRAVRFRQLFLQSPLLEQGLLPGLRVALDTKRLRAV